MGKAEEKVLTVFGTKGTSNEELKGPNDVKYDQQGRYIVADTFNHRISWFDEVTSVKREFKMPREYRAVGALAY